MINLLLGAPGGGKSYEAVAYHVLPALNAGRKVITNLPLVLSEFPPEQRALLDIRTQARGKGERPTGLAAALGEVADAEIFRRPFSTGECYGDPWRHPESGSGPLYVIDECHMCLPRDGTGRKVREWYSMHRHELVDVLLITQSHGKVCKDIIDLVQVCYRVRKATAFGTNGSYIRKVLDGVRGDVVNTGVRKYDKRYFKFYRSHTKTSEAGAELAANDIVPLWRRWPFIGLGICIVALVAILSSAKSVNPIKAGTNQVTAARSRAVSPASSPAAVPVVGSPVAARKDEHGEGEPNQGRKSSAGVGPFGGLGIHVMGRVRLATGREVYSLALSQNGQRIFTTTSDELVEAGYQVKRLSDCAMSYSYQGAALVAVCDAPQLAITPAEGTLGKKPEGRVSPAEG